MKTRRIASPGSCSGFTLLELVIVILITGILSFMAIGRLNNTGEVNAHGFAEQVASTLRYAQQAAVSQRRLIYVNASAASGLVNACLDSSTACAQPLSAPGGGNLSVQAPSSVTFTTNATQFSFDALGRPSTSSQVQITVSASDGQAFNITVQPDSGYVQRS
jgi:MSHA pilin protein MshC